MFPIARTSSPFRRRRRDPVRFLVLVDGEHYPPVVEAALNDVVARGDEVAAALLVGGSEKLPGDGIEAFGPHRVLSGADPRSVLDDAIIELRPDRILDLSDEPVLDYRKRMELISIALHRRIPYDGTDFSFEPPRMDPIAAKPSISVIGTGKRTGKTAVAGFAARTLVGIGHHPIVVAMGRGGPAQPEVLHGDEVTLEPRQLVELAEAGKHAASDYVEDALLARVKTVGCRRCGGGLAGGVEISNVAEGVRIANDLPGDLLLLEGSGSSLPPVRADATILIVPASIPEEYLAGYLGTYRLLLADFVVVTMCEEPFGSPSKISSLSTLIEEAWDPGTKGKVPRGETEVVRTVFRPTPTRSVAGARVFVTTTAPEVVGDSIKRHLEAEHGCEVVGISHSLSSRHRLQEELRGLGDRADVLLCEVKAAGIDVATRTALEEGLEVAYMDNVPEGIEGDDPAGLIERAGVMATTRFRQERE
jgi:cyclic 2,3-diphosphoglycerate synthetase